MRFIALFVALCSVGNAQEYADFHGTYIHSKVVEVLNETRSIQRALSARPITEPIYMVIDSTKPNGEITASYQIGSQVDLLCRKSSFAHAGIKWGIGNEQGPYWVLTRDETSGTYIALTPADSLEKQPIVLGKMPSKNADPMFILRRMVNASMLSGVWAMDAKKNIEFTMNQFMVINGKPTPYSLQISPDGSTVTISTTNGRPLRWVVQRDGPNLTMRALQQHRGTILPMATVKLRYLRK